MIPIVIGGLLLASFVCMLIVFSIAEKYALVDVGMKPSRIPVVPMRGQIYDEVA